MTGKGLVESALDPANASYRYVIPAGDPWIREVEQGEVIRLVDLDGNATAETLVYNAQDYSDRYSAQDTIRTQKNIFLTAGSRLVSTANHVLLTIVADTCGRHDTIGGACATESNMVLYSLEKRHVHACRQNFVKAVLDWGHGLSKRDLVTNVSFFRYVAVTPEGGLSPPDHACEPGNYVEMRAEMDLLVLISNCPQVSYTGTEGVPAGIEVLIWDGQDG